jgi:sulfate adenylyltransferase subunit 1
MNDVGVAEIELTRTLFFDPYSNNRTSGSFILIDPQSNATLAAGMIRRGRATDHAETSHKPALIYFASEMHVEHLIVNLEKVLLREGTAVVRTRVTAEKTLHGLLSLGLVVLVPGAVNDETRNALEAVHFAVIDSSGFVSADELTKHLEEIGVLGPRQGEAV